jgi:hypothetical protein
MRKIVPKGRRGRGGVCVSNWCKKYLVRGIEKIKCERKNGEENVRKWKRKSEIYVKCSKEYGSLPAPTRSCSREESNLQQ